MSTSKIFNGYNSSLKPVSPNTKVTDILVRGGGGTITFSDGVTVEYMFGFKPDASVPSGGMFDVTLVGDRAQRVYQNIVSQSICDMVDWILQCSDLNRRVALLELNAGLAKQFEFESSDWDGGTINVIEIPNEGPLSPGQIGPHELGINRVYHITVWKQNMVPVVVGIDVEYEINVDLGLIKIKKAGLTESFDGRVIIS